jgi:hypothetical protein
MPRQGDSRVRNRHGGATESRTLHRLVQMAEVIRDCGAAGIEEWRLGLRFGLGPATMRCDNRRVILGYFRDISFDDGVYRSDPQLEAELIVAARRKENNGGR